MSFFIKLLVTIISWGISMAVFKVVTVLAGVSFDLKVASGIWLLLGYLKWFFIWDRKESD